MDDRFYALQKCLLKLVTRTINRAHKLLVWRQGGEFAAQVFNVAVYGSVADQATVRVDVVH